MEEKSMKITEKQVREIKELEVILFNKGYKCDLPCNVRDMTQRQAQDM